MEQLLGMKQNIEEVFYAALDFTPISKERKEHIKEMYPLIKDALIEKSRKNKMMPFVAKLMIELQCDVDYWNSILDEFRYRNQDAVDEASIVFAELNAKNQKGCFLIENFAALLTADEDIAMFASGDIDIYAGHAEHKIVHDIMAKLGYRRTVANEYQGYYYCKENSPIGINMMWMWQAKKNEPFITSFELKNMGGGTGETVSHCCLLMN